MENPAVGGALIDPDDPRDVFNWIVLDLVALISQVQTSIHQIDATIAGDAAPGSQEATDLILLDDVTPRYLKARDALITCDTSLGAALQDLLDTGSRESIRSRDSTSSFYRLSPNDSCRTAPGARGGSPSTGSIGPAVGRSRTLRLIPGVSNPPSNSPSLPTKAVTGCEPPGIGQPRRPIARQPADREPESR